MPRNIGEELIKPACIKIVEGLCAPQAAEKVKSDPLSNNTVKDRIDQIAENCKKQLQVKLRKVKFAIQLDETTTVAGYSVLIVYVGSSVFRHRGPGGPPRSAIFTDGN